MQLRFLVEVVCFWPEYGFQVRKTSFISKMYRYLYFGFLLHIAARIPIYFDLFLGYDILSHETETDILDGMVSIIIATLFVSLGVYSQR